jgi:twinkle protein|tara:strand:- start:232 stop:1182 length:951 start_codon:yes stop_codon:yes gene_type:complete
VIVDRISVSDFSQDTLDSVLAEKTQHRVNWLNRHKDKILSESSESVALQGIQTPWEKLHDKLVLQFGCVSTWIGIDGHKKSSVLNQIVAFAARDNVVGLCSLEMDVRSIGELLCKQALGAVSPTNELKEKFIDWTENRILVYDHVGTCKPLEVYALILKMVRDYGARFIVIDCLQMVESVCGDNEKERAFFAMLVQLAKGFNIHIAVVHHARKPEKGGDEYIPTRFDALGSGAISQLSSILAIVWSDKKKQRLLDLKELGQDLDVDDTEYLSRPDTKIVIAKNRHIPWENTVGLWQHPSRQFCGSPSLQRLNFELD